MKFNEILKKSRTYFNFSMIVINYFKTFIKDPTEPNTSRNNPRLHLEKPRTPGPFARGPNNRLFTGSLCLNFEWLNLRTKKACSKSILLCFLIFSFKSDEWSSSDWSFQFLFFSLFFGHLQRALVYLIREQNLSYLLVLLLCSFKNEVHNIIFYFQLQPTSRQISCSPIPIDNSVIIIATLLDFAMYGDGLDL